MLRDASDSASDALPGLVQRPPSFRAAPACAPAVFARVSRMLRVYRFLIVMICFAVAALLAGCPSQPIAHDSGEKQQAAARVGAWSRGGGKIQGVNLNDPIRPAATDEAIVVSAAKNEWASFSLQVSGLPARQPANRKIAYSFRLAAPKRENGDGGIALDHFTAAQILPMPVDVNRAGFVRHTGLEASSRPLPRALLPV